MENIGESVKDFYVGNKRTLGCGDCGNTYLEYHDKMCFAYSTGLLCREDVCVKCRTYRAAKLEFAIEEMAEQLGFEIRHGKRSTAALLGLMSMAGRKTLPIGLERKLDEIPLVYPEVIKNNTCLPSCSFCNENKHQALQEASDSGSETKTEKLNKNEIYIGPSAEMEGIISLYIKLNTAPVHPSSPSELTFCNCCSIYTKSTSTCKDCCLRYSVGCDKDCLCCGTDSQKSKDSSEDINRIGSGCSDI